jgi:hypothetical protein
LNFNTDSIHSTLAARCGDARPLATQLLDTTRDLTVTWNSAGYLLSDVVELSIAGSTNPFIASTKTYCQAPAADGTLTIPAAQLQMLPKSASLTASVSPHSDQTPNFRLPQRPTVTLPLQFTYYLSGTFPITLR